MSFLFLLSVLLPVHAQTTPIDQKDLLKDEIKNKVVSYFISAPSLLYKRKHQPQFSEVIKKYPQAVKLLQQKQKTNWDLNNPENFLSFGYDDMTDVFVRRYGFCSGYTYITWVLRYLVTFDPSSVAKSPTEIIKQLNQVLREFKPVKISGFSGLKSLSSIPEINRYLKLEIGRAWQEQSVGMDGLGVYLGKFQGKKTNWNELNRKVKYYIDRGIFPILTAMNRGEWRGFGNPDETGMLHVMPAVGWGPFDMNAEIWSKVTPGLYRDTDIMQGNLIYDQRQSLKLLNTLATKDFMFFIEDEEQIDVLNLFTQTNGSSTISQAGILRDIYMDAIYYADRLAAQVAISLATQ